MPGGIYKILPPPPRSRFVNDSSNVNQYCTQLSLQTGEHLIKNSGIAKISEFHSIAVYFTTGNGKLVLPRKEQFFQCCVVCEGVN